MQCCCNRSLIFLLSLVACVSVRADFNAATKAYLLGEFEKARYEALIAATDGKPEAQMLLGQLYFNGEGVEKDMKAAMYWYEKAAEQGFADAQYRVGSLYYDGKHDIPKDYNKAYNWLQKALKNGNNNAKPKLEGLFELDTGKVVNLNESLEELQAIANTGNQQARFLYSQRLLKGAGFPQDKVKAVSMLTEDAKQGFVKAQKRLGELYYYGDGVAEDYYEAYAWSMAYAGTKELGGLAREGKQTARSALRKLDDEKHHAAYVKSREYFEKYVLPFHPNAREVGPEKYRIVVRSRKAQLAQAQQQKQKQKQARTTKTLSTGIGKFPKPQSCAELFKNDKSSERTKKDVAAIFDQNKGLIFSVYNRTLRKDPDLQGKVVYEIDINPTGQVTRIDKRADSTLDAPGFEAELVQRINGIDFCKKGTKPFTIAFPINFIPTKSGQVKKADPALERTIAAVERSQGISNNQEKVLDKLALTANPNMSKSIQPKPSPALSTQTPIDATKPVTGTVSLEKSHKEQVKSTTSISSMNSTKGNTSSDSSKTQTATVDSTKLGTKTAPDTSTEKEARSYREIHNVFIRHRSRINDLYLRAHEQNRNLKGRIVFELTIAPSGKVETVGITSSELDAPTLEEELVDYIKNMSFESKNSDPFEISYPLDFLP